VEESDDEVYSLEDEDRLASSPSSPLPQFYKGQTSHEVGQSGLGAMYPYSYTVVPVLRQNG
jgi:hypothetical protein